MIGRINIASISILPEVVSEFNAIPLKIPAVFL
jgi:hypothetical protein